MGKEESESRLHHLAFFGNLVPCFMDHTDGLDAFKKLLEGGSPDKTLKRQCLMILAEQCAALQLDWESARFALQQVLDGMFWPIRRSQEMQKEAFRECLDLTLDIADSHGLFFGCYEIVTPALAASALQQLLEVIDGHTSRKSEMLQILSQELSRKVGAHPCAGLPLTAWVEWSGSVEDASGSPSSLPFLLYAALRTDTGRKLLDLDQVNGSYRLDVLDELRREKGRQQNAGDATVYAAVRRAARYHLLIEAVAEKVARGPITPAELSVLLDVVGCGSADEPEPETLLFFHCLVTSAGSLAAAGRALERLLPRSGREGTTLHAWAAALAKPENAAGGPNKTLSSFAWARLEAVQPGTQCNYVMMSSQALRSPAIWHTLMSDSVSFCQAPVRILGKTCPWPACLVSRA